jgi:peroxiredoxin
MQSRINAQSLPFIADFDPEFDYEISIAHYMPRRSVENRLLRQPPTVGSVAPAFEARRQDGLWQRLPSHLFNAEVISLQDLVDYKPLVVSFHAPEWGAYGKAHLELLDKSHRKINGLGGQLLVFTSISAERIPTVVRENGLQLNLLHDGGNRIAELFGVYSKAYPVWQSVAGVDADVPFPATFAVAQNGVVVYDFVNQNLDELFKIRDVLTAIYSVKDARQVA